MCSVYGFIIVKEIEALNLRETVEYIWEGLELRMRTENNVIILKFQKKVIKS